MDANPQQQLADRLKQANNILVTVSANPTVDQLAACIGLTLILNHLGKHAAAVFSGNVPSTIEFLKPEETLEKTTDSLRDFIIALDKSKADKLRYKVEDQVVRIFITPYRTSISEKDLEFSQGDFNVDVVVALGVHEQSDLDKAITAHGRILHDATVATINTTTNGDLGSLNWIDPKASSLSELVVNLADMLDKSALDVQTSTALLTGIVAATDRFSNEKTTPRTMSASAELMAAGANQQLVATQLTAPPEPDNAPQNNEGADSTNDQPPKEPGMLEIDHEPSEPAQPQVHIDEHGELVTDGQPGAEPTAVTPEADTIDAEADIKNLLNPNTPEPEISKVRGVSPGGDVTESNPSDGGESPSGDASPRQRVDQPPMLGGQLTANTAQEIYDPTTEALTLPAVNTPVLSHNETVLNPAEPAPQSPAPAPEPPADLPPTPPEPTTPVETPTEPSAPAMPEPASVQPSPEASAEPASSVDAARNAVEEALTATSPNQPLPPIEALNAQPLGDQLHDETLANLGFSESVPGNTPADQTLDMPLPPQTSFTPAEQPPSAFPAPQNGDNSAPPAPQVPPPFVPPPQQ